MSFLNTIKNLFRESEDVRSAAEMMIEAMSKEAIKSGNPEALMHVAQQWELLQDGNPALASVDITTPALPSADYTSADEMKPVVIKIMQEAYLGGVEQVTNGTIKKQLDRVKQATGGWKDGDMEDTDPKPGIQPRWHKTLSLALKEMRQSGEIANDSVNWRTYTLAAHLIPALPAGQEPKQLAGAWEVV
jgi:hypothetical protein